MMAFHGHLLSAADMGYDTLDRPVGVIHFLSLT